MTGNTPSPGPETAPVVETSTKAPSASPAPVEESIRRLRLLPLSLLALIVGVITGFGAVVFRGLIGLIHNLFFLGQFSFIYDSSVFTPFNPWCPAIILVPVIGGIGVTWIVSNFAPEAKGHGVPEVMDAIYYKQGIIRPIVAVVKSVASAIAIGTGAAVGREGPIIQIGSALGSTLGQIIRMQAGQRITLVAAGAGAGIAATFNTPIGGVLFAYRTDAAGDQRQHLSPCSRGDRHGYLHRPTVLRRSAGVQRTNQSDRDTRSIKFRCYLGSLCCSRSPDRGCRGGVHSRITFDRRRLRSHSGPLHPAHTGHVAGRDSDLRAVDQSRALLCRGRWLLVDPGHSAGPYPRRRLPSNPVHCQAVGNLGQPRVGVVRRDLLAVAVHGRGTGCGFRVGNANGVPWHAGFPARLRYCRHGRNGRRRYWRGDDRRDDDLRDDPRLPDRPAHDPGGRDVFSVSGGCYRPRTFTQ